jgi:hypothetical protein
VCPYRGLESYGPDDARWFFGRTELTAALVARLAERAAGPAGPLMVIGASGAGKSSLLRAGLLPALRAGGLGLPGSARWPVCVITPGADPLGALAAPFAGPAQAPAAVRARLAADPAALAGLVADALPDPAPAGDGDAAPVPRLVLVVDQFEELFDPEVAQADRLAFVAALAAAAPSGTEAPGALVVVGMRADFFGRAAEHPELQPALGSPVVVGPMTGEQARQVIDGPAREAGLDLEAGMAELLLADLRLDHTHHAVQAAPAGGQWGTGVLPLLSHALLATWQRREGRVADHRRLPGQRASRARARRHRRRRLRGPG